MQGSLGTGQMDSLLDFDFNDQAISFVSGIYSRNFRKAGMQELTTRQPWEVSSAVMMRMD